jgi:hypothetical protein
MTPACQVKPTGAEEPAAAQNSGKPSKGAWKGASLPMLRSAIAAHADEVITTDKHFAPLAEAGYNPQPITPEAFFARYRGGYG